MLARSQQVKPRVVPAVPHPGDRVRVEQASVLRNLSQFIGGTITAALGGMHSNACRRLQAFIRLVQSLVVVGVTACSGTPGGETGSGGAAGSSTAGGSSSLGGSTAPTSGGIASTGGNSGTGSCTLAACPARGTYQSYNCQANSTCCDGTVLRTCRCMAETCSYYFAN